MKKQLLYSAIALATLAGTTSCGDDFLVLDPVGSVSEGTLTTQEGIDMVLTGAYSTLNNMTQAHWMGAASVSNYAFGDIAGADANKGSSAGDQPDLTEIETFQFTSANSYIAGKWTAIYESVKRCNNVLDMVTKAADLKDGDVIAAQAQFLKAFWMFEGIRVFGAAIPYISLEDYQASTDPTVSNVDESGNYVYIWDKVEADFKAAIDKLPETWTSTGEYGRINKSAAKAMLAKFYIYWSSPYNGKNGNAGVNKWAEAKSLLEDVMKNGKDSKGNAFKLAKTYGELFDADTSDWTGESIFDVQLTISGTETDTNAISYTPAIGQPGASGIGGWGFYQPTYAFVNSFMVDAAGLPVDNYLTSPITTTTAGADPSCDLTIYTDPRVDYCAGRFGVPFLDYGTPKNAQGWVREYTNGGWYMNKKNLPKISDRGNTSVGTAVASSAKNYHILRLAEVYLMYAECAIQNNDLATAMEYINKVRARAVNGYIADDPSDWNTKTYAMEDLVNGKTIAGTAANYRLGLYKSFASADEATKALRREYRAEFGMEGHHWFDLVRWNAAVDELNAYATWENGVLNRTKFQKYGANMSTFPIPQAQIQTAEGRFVQNENWK